MVLFYQNEDDNNIVVNFTLRGISAGFLIITPSDQELDTLPVYEITIPLSRDLYSNFHAENEMASQQSATIRREQRVVIYRGERREGGNLRVILLDIWTVSSDGLLLPMIR